LTTFYDAVEATQIYLELTGEAFWVILKQNNIPREIWLVRPDWVKIKPDPKEIIKHYTYHPGGVYNEKVIIPKDQMIHFKYFHPLNPYRGKGSIQAAALPLDIHTFAQEWNRNFFYNSAIPSLVFTSERKMNTKVIKRFLEQWQASYGGRSKSNKIAFLGGGMKMDKTMMGAKELDFTEQQRMMRDDVLAVFKVPKTILGMTDDVNRANALATTRSFMERVITPRMRKFVGTLTEFLIPMYSNSTNLFFDFTNPAPEDLEAKLKEYANARKYTWMTPNEIRVAEGLEPIEGGDDLFAPLAGGAKGPTFSLPSTTSAEGKGIKGLLGLGKEKEVEKNGIGKTPRKKKFEHMMPMPVKRIEEIRREKLKKGLTRDLTKFIGRMLKSEDGEEQSVGFKKKPKREEGEPLFTEEAKDAYWKRFIEVVTEREEEMKDKVTDLFNEQEKLILERLEKDVRYWRKDYRKGKESSVVPSVDELSIIWNAIFLAYIKEIFIEQGNYTLDFLGTGGQIDSSTDESVEYLREHGAELIKSINTTTRDQLRETLAEGFEAGEGIPKLRKRVEEVFSEATRNRAGMIARTEVLRASNFGTLEAYRQSEVVEAQEWLAERDGRACIYCLEMDGKIIGLDKKWFKSGDKLTVEGQTLKISDLAVTVPNEIHPNCRCTTLPVLVGT
jgi:HK97 family phage portal protein